MQSMKLNWEFQGGREGSSEKPAMLEVWIFSGTIHYVFGLVYVHPIIFTEFITETYSTMVNVSY